MEILAFILIFFSVVFIQGIVYEKYIFHKLDYTCEFSQKESFEGDNIFLVETIYNKKLLPILWLKAVIHSSKWLDYAETNSVIAQENRKVTSTFFLRSYQKTVRRWNLTCLKRGVFDIENITLIGGDLFGNTISSTAIGLNTQLIVFPQIIDIEKILIPINYNLGDILARRWIIDDPFLISGTREYFPGDPMNKVHWNASAREGKLIVRKNDFSIQLSLNIILNIQSIEYEYDSVVDKDIIELGIKVAATLLDSASSMGLPVRFISNSCTTDDSKSMIYTCEGSGKNHIKDILSILAKLQLKNLRDFDDFLGEYCNNILNAQIIIITTYINSNIIHFARKAKSNGNYMRIIILDSLIDKAKLPADIDLYIL